MGGGERNPELAKYVQKIYWNYKPSLARENWWQFAQDEQDEYKDTNTNRKNLKANRIKPVYDTLGNTIKTAQNTYWFVADPKVLREISSGNRAISFTQFTSLLGLIGAEKLGFKFVPFQHGFARLSPSNNEYNEHSTASGEFNIVEAMYQAIDTDTEAAVVVRTKKNGDLHAAGNDLSKVDMPSTQLTLTKNTQRVAQKPKRKFHLNPKTADKHKKLLGFIHNTTEDYEPHGIETLFEDFHRNPEIGYWILTGGPGVGKTSIMASLAKKFELNSKCIPYFFRYESDRRLSEAVDAFEHYVKSVVQHHLAEQISTFEDKNNIDLLLDSCKNLDDFLWKISELPDITTENPLIIMIDAIDEVSSLDQYAALKPFNPLKLPSVLPNGVKIAFSTRHDLSNENLSWIQSAAHTINLKSDDVQELHEQTVINYVTRTCQALSYIVPFHDLKSQKERDRFIEERCEQAHFNFMILRASLHDEAYWKAGGTGKELASDLEGYYKTLFARMTVDNEFAPIIKSLAPYAFALSPDVSKWALTQILGGGDQNADSEEINKTIDTWIAQGLLIAIDGEWLTIYHRTFRQYLEDELDKKLNYQILGPIADALSKDVSLDEDLNWLNDLSPAVRNNWLKLVTITLLKGELFAKLPKFLLNVDVWKAIAGSTGSVTNYRAFALVDLLSLLCNFNPTEGNAVNYKVLMSDLAKELYVWAVNGDLHLGSGDPILELEIYRIMKNTLESNTLLFNLYDAQLEKA